MGEVYEGSYEEADTLKKKTHQSQIINDILEHKKISCSPEFIDFFDIFNSKIAEQKFKKYLSILSEHVHFKEIEKYASKIKYLNIIKDFSLAQQNFKIKEIVALQSISHFKKFTHDFTTEELHLFCKNCANNFSHTINFQLFKAYPEILSYAPRSKILEKQQELCLKEGNSFNINLPQILFLFMGQEKAPYDHPAYTYLRTHHIQELHQRVEKNNRHKYLLLIYWTLMTHTFIFVC